MLEGSLEEQSEELENYLEDNIQNDQDDIADYYKRLSNNLGNNECKAKKQLTY